MQATAISNRNPPFRPANSLAVGHRMMSEETNPSQSHCPDIAENAPDELDSSNTCQLRKRGIARLRKALGEQFSVFPSQSYSPLPVLKVVVKDLIQHIQGQIRKSRGATGGEAGRDVEEKFGVEIYGGVARAIVAADVGEEVFATDFDVRFFIDGCDFDSCRRFVEEYLLQQLIAALPPSYPSAPDTTLVRFSYFQKQVVIGSCFSLLSFGNPTTGKNVDVEFCPSRGLIRNYFDDANAFVIPLTPSILRKRKPCLTAEARCLSGGFREAVNLLLRSELVIQDPPSVVNGLTLYTHTLCVKRLTPRTMSDELAYGKLLARAFITEARRTRQRGSDPLRLVRSFIRSHYSAEPLSALALCAQLSALLLGFGSATPSDVEHLSPPIAELMSGAACSALERADGNEASLAAIIAVARFAVNPRGHKEESAEARSVSIQLPSARSIRLLRLPQAEVDMSALVSVALARLEERCRLVRAGGGRPLPGLRHLIEVLKEPAGVLAHPTAEEEAEEEHTHKQDKLGHEQRSQHPAAAAAGCKQRSGPEVCGPSHCAPSARASLPAKKEALGEEAGAAPPGRRRRGS